MEGYLKFAKMLAEESEEIALKYFGFDTESVWKGDNTPLTQADTEINALVIKKVKETYPDHSILGEEENHIKENSRYVWVCDPIDGTMPFSLGMPTFTFSIALVDQSDGQPILGLINDPVRKNMYWAYKNGGAFRNGKEISVTPSPDLRKTYLSIEGSRTRSGFAKTRIIDALREHGGEVMTLLSFIYGGIQVANGKFSGAIFLNEFAHDVAALKIITEEAGGKVTDLNGKERRYDQLGLGCIISNGIVHEEILACVKECKI